MWAQGSNLQTNTQFSVSLEVDGTQVGTTIQTQASGLSTPAKEYVGEGTADFNISTGQTIAAHITVSERGTGGDLLYGSVSHPSRIILGATPVTSSTFPQAHKAGTSIVVRTQVDDVWGVEDVDLVEQFIAGPYATRELNIDPNSITEDKIVAKADLSEQTVTDKTASGMNVSWTWIYQGMKSGSTTIKPGIYYLVGKVHCKGSDRTNSRIYSSAGPVVVSAPAQFLGSAGSAILVAIFIGGVAVVIYFYALRTERLRTDKGRAVATLLMIAIVVGAGMYAFLVAVPSSSQSGGANAPDFKVTTIDEKGFSLADQKGKVVVLDLFATWCPTCNAMMPTIVKLHQRYTGAVFISISPEGSGDTEDTIRTFQTKYGADWSFAKDTDNVWPRYQDVTDPHIPTLVIINPQGKISYRHVGEASLDDLSKQVDKASRGGYDLGISTQGQDLVFVAFITGVFAFFSPCAFPLLPGYMGYVLARREDANDPKAGPVPVGRSVVGGILAASGALALFLLAGLAVATAGAQLVIYIPYLTPVIAVIIAVMGILMLFDKAGWTDKIMGLLSPITSRVQTRIQGAVRNTKGGRAGNLGLFLYGVGYGVASMGCHAPVFVAIMIAGFVAGGFASALLVFIMFGLGMGIMMVTVTVLVGMAKGMVIKRMQSAMPMIKRLSGLILLIAGIYLAWYSLNAILAVSA
jgi:cytochrome c biogenesis protein CcdA/peroxiredoxin